nr:type I-F CRISPR-associated endoribonuclease Cas6/Csy4 [Vibrio splendidus]MCC4880740.1 type I-F CRISPR-associated endoribonuclease Cas6/Csy4 [Vibrio splendidus]
MSSRFYFDVYVPGSARAANEVLGKVLRVAHGHIAANELNSISVGFPNYYESSHPDKSTLGDTMRLVGDKFDLNMLSKSPTLFGLEEDFGIEVGKVKEVPEDALDVIFTRDRSIDKKIKFGYENRTEQNRDAFPPYVMVASGSKRSSFPFHVKMKKAEMRKDGVYSGYGMSVEGSTFPIF